MKNNSSPSRKKVLHVGDYWYGGGAEKVLRQTVDLSDQLGTDNRVHTALSRKRNPLGYVFSLLTARELNQILREFSPDIVHLQNFHHELSPSVLWSLRRYKRSSPDVRVIYTAHDMHLICPNSGYQYFDEQAAHNIPLSEVPVRILRRYDARSFAHSVLKIAQHVISYRLLKLHNNIDLVVAPSNFLGSLIGRHYDQLLIRVLRNPVDALPEIDSRPELPTFQEQSFKNSNPRLVFVGRISSEKGLAEFLQLCSPYFLRREITLDIFGDGPEVSTLKQLITALGIGHSVTFGGVLDSDQVRQRMKEYSVLILPSTWYENAPLVVCEAASTGLPVLVRSLGGAEELVKKVRWGRSNDLVDREQTLSDIRLLAAHAGENAVIDPEEFSEEHYKSELKAIYRIP